MRKIFAFLTATVDGYYEGPDGEFDWPVVDDEFNEFSVAQLDEVDTLLFGRVTYEGMEEYWTTPEALADDPEIAPLMNSIAKIVVSTTLDEARWNNTRLISSDVASELSALKKQPGKDIAIFGSSSLTVSLLEAGLIDEVRVMVMPVILGAGKSMFRTANQRFSLTLAQSRPFKSGNILLTYRPVQDSP